jgi:hypothetical protein
MLPRGGMISCCRHQPHCLCRQRRPAATGMGEGCKVLLPMEGEYTSMGKLVLYPYFGTLTKVLP